MPECAGAPSLHAWAFFGFLLKNFILYLGEKKFKKFFLLNSIESITQILDLTG
jgi:hypothetical protein